MHPFLDDSFLPDWSSLRSEHVVSDVRRAIEIAQAEIDAVASLPQSECRYATVFARLEEAMQRFERVWSLVHHLDAVNDSPDLRAAVNEVQPEVSRFFLHRYR